MLYLQILLTSAITIHCSPFPSLQFPLSALRHTTLVATVSRDTPPTTRTLVTGTHTTNRTSSLAEGSFKSGGAAGTWGGGRWGDGSWDAKPTSRSFPLPLPGTPASLLPPVASSSPPSHYLLPIASSYSPSSFPKPLPATSLLLHLLPLPFPSCLLHLRLRTTGDGSVTGCGGPQSKLGLITPALKSPPIMELRMASHRGGMYIGKHCVTRHTGRSGGARLPTETVKRLWGSGES